MATKETTDKLFLPRNNQQAWVIQKNCVNTPKGSLSDTMQKDVMGSDDSSTYLSTYVVQNEMINFHNHFLRDLIFPPESLSLSKDAEKFTIVG